MKLNANKLFNFRNVLYILLILLVVIVGYNVFVYLNIFEGANEINNNVKTIVISPLENTPPEWLNIHKIKLIDVDGNNMTYTAKSSNGRWPHKHYEFYLDTDSLYNTSTSVNSMFHSGSTNCNLTITLDNPSKILSKITITNRLDCCQFRLKHYKMNLKNISGIDIIPALTFNRPDVFDANKNYTETIVIPILSNINSNVTNGGSIQNP